MSKGPLTAISPHIVNFHPCSEDTFRNLFVSTAHGCDSFMTRHYCRQTCARTAPCRRPEHRSAAHTKHDTTLTAELYGRISQRAIDGSMGVNRR